MEEMRDLPVGAVWAEFCRRQEVPTGAALVTALEGYQRQVSARG